MIGDELLIQPAGNKGRRQAGEAERQPLSVVCLIEANFGLLKELVLFVGRSIC
jgi:hypothetical protein